MLSRSAYAVRCGTTAGAPTHCCTADGCRKAHTLRCPAGALASFGASLVTAHGCLAHGCLATSLPHAGVTRIVLLHWSAPAVSSIFSCTRALTQHVVVSLSAAACGCKQCGTSRLHLMHLKIFPANWAACIWSLLCCGEVMWCGSHTGLTPRCTPVVAVGCTHARHSRVLQAPSEGGAHVHHAVVGHPW
ncbi:hypothetical protein COO60DRAFT_106748 [Scenedesmus sp. NREL 46B-D3]|nr:hypothetical protein COO60DRAFT_106748 [Scenedesmus sp. NREL 46B-D3]